MHWTVFWSCTEGAWKGKGGEGSSNFVAVRQHRYHRRHYLRQSKKAALRLQASQLLQHARNREEAAMAAQAWIYLCFRLRPRRMGSLNSRVLVLQSCHVSRRVLDIAYLHQHTSRFTREMIQQCN